MVSLLSPLIYLVAELDKKTSGKGVCLVYQSGVSGMPYFENAPLIKLVAGEVFFDNLLTKQS